MNERIDHAREARAWVKGAERPDVQSDLTAALAAIGQVHATLALVEQQRVANLIQLMHIPVGDLNESIRSALHAAFHDDRDWEAELREGVGLT